ncbi:hypothetical protein P171DRAFT_439001 [Karstenula rhodostoma CBS 690.94]|uniref:FHA domain-containing protein n=1 Tax=Karstenula rhodostoma CBS 690.94 TaxID=1392251 RepID=A0A9P4UHK7_9PLEO|nr:hypothetical protein P171DRAFT_439001 [Karstenula rhodostoma CBS 690.94]
MELSLRGSRPARQFTTPNHLLSLPVTNSRHGRIRDLLDPLFFSPPTLYHTTADRPPAARLHLYTSTVFWTGRTTRHGTVRVFDFGLQHGLLPVHQGAAIASGARATALRAHAEAVAAPRVRTALVIALPASQLVETHHLKYYPTPVPTSSTGILVSSPQKRPVFDRAISALSERQPLGAVPTVDLPANGDIVRMGRSSNSSDYQLSANRLISRVHVQAAYYAPTASYPNGYIEVECIGWNGAKIHCGGNVFELNKNDTYMSENPDQEILLDVQDTRVMIAWPQVPAKPSWDSEDDLLSPTRRQAQDHFASSPPLIPRSPVSQSPIRQPVFGAVPSLPPPLRPVQIFEDEDAREDNGTATPTPTSPLAADETFIRPSQSRSIGPDAEAMDMKASIGPSFNEDSFSDGDEENDPIVHSFGPFGQNINSRLASFSTATPIPPLSAHRRRSLMKSASPRKSSSSELARFKESPIKNHIINQLAYSRIHSQPLSAIHSNLPAELKACQSKKSDGEEGSGASTPVPQFSKQDLRQLMDRIPCIGEIPRSGKDAAGQPLENEFYYVPEMDSNMLRRETVGVRGTGLRSVRKQHKQYYWKKPRV